MDRYSVPVVKSNPAALRREREQAGHTCRSLSRASGIGHPRISQLEAASIPVRPTTAKRLADALGVRIADITIPSAAASPWGGDRRERSVFARPSQASSAPGTETERER